MKTDIFFNLDRYEFTFKIEDKDTYYWNDTLEKILKLQETIRLLRRDIKKEKIKELAMMDGDRKILDYLLKFFNFNTTDYDNYHYLQVNPDENRPFDIHINNGLYNCKKKYKYLASLWHKYDEIKDLTIPERIKYQEKVNYTRFLSFFNCLSTNGSIVIHNFGFNKNTIKLMYISLLLFNRITVYDQYIALIEFNPKISFEQLSSLLDNISKVSFSKVEHLDDFSKYFYNKIEFNYNMYKYLSDNNYDNYFRYMNYLHLNSYINLSDYSSIDELLYENLNVTTSSNEEIKNAVKPQEGKFIYNIIKENKFEKCLQIGMGYGIGALYITSALESIGKGCLTSIDPYQRKQFNNMGMDLISNLKREKYHKLIEDEGFLYIPTLIKEKKKFNFILIDGRHTFDHALVDFLMCDQILEIYGIIVLSDTIQRGMNKVTKYLDTNYTHYKKIATPNTITAYKKINEDQRTYDFHENF